MTSPALDDPPDFAALESLAAPAFAVCDRYLHDPHPFDIDLAVFDATAMIVKGVPLAFALDLIDSAHPAAFEVGKALVVVARRVHALRTMMCR